MVFPWVCNIATTESNIDFHIVGLVLTYCLKTSISFFKMNQETRWLKLKTTATTRLNHIQTASPKWHVLKHETAPYNQLAHPRQDPYPVKNGIWGGGVVLKFHFKIQFLQSCFLNDQYSSSFHVIGKHMKIKYLRLAPEELSTCQTEAAHM